MSKKTDKKHMLCVVLLICLGILIILVPLIYQYNNCAYRWLHNLDAFGKKHDSVWDCFWSRSKGAILICFLTGFVPISAAIELCLRMKNLK